MSTNCMFIYQLKGIRSGLFSVLFILLAFSLSGQTWTERYNDDGTPKTMEELIDSFNDYWKGRKIEKGKGYKPFQRWKYRWENQMTSEGKFQFSGYKYIEFNRFLKGNPSEIDSRMSTAWQSLGPNSTTGGYAGTGRVNAVAFDPSNSDIIYVGSAGGGLWKSTDNGLTWTPKTDFIGSIGISKIIVHPTNTNTIYIATGDKDAGDNYSIGVLKSTDGGDTWLTTGLDWSYTNGRLIRGMVMDMDDSNMLIVTSSNGIWKTTDGGDTWSSKANGNFGDLVHRPSSTSNTFYASASNQIYRSTDNGENWSSIYTVSGANRLELAITENDDAYIYALASNSSGSGFNGVYRSTNSGGSFTQMSSSPNILGWASDGSDSGGQGWYDLALAVSPSDKNKVHVGGVNHWKSSDGGASWVISSHWSGSGGITTVHADKHVLEYQDSNTLWEGNDGGIYKTTDDGVSWTDRTSNLVISQMYRVGVAETSSRVMAGLQDNGSKMKKNDGTWEDEIGGDGMDCAIDPTNDNVLYGCIQLGEIRRSTNGGGSWTDIQSNIPGSPQGAWVTPYRIFPSNTSKIIAGYEDVWISDNRGDTWSKIGENLENGSDMTHLAVAPSDSNYVYTGRNNSIHRTTDGGSSWTALTVPTTSIRMIKVSSTDPDHIFLVRGGFSAGQKVYESTNAGDSWTNISGNLPNLGANCVAVHNDADGTIYVGMDVGVYYRNASTTDWVLYDAGLPNVEISEIEIKENTDELYLATYGRGVWKNNTIGTSNICKIPLNVSLESVGFDEATFSWDTPSLIPAEGYEWVVSTSSDIPTSGYNTTMDFTVTATDLTQGTEYYFFLRSKCATDDTSTWYMLGPFSTSYSCGGMFYDTGGSSGEYGNGEDKIWTICPSSEGGSVTLNFTSLDIESNWDALYVYNGQNIEAPLFDSGNGATQAGFPAGGYYGTNAPGPFTSTDGSGCLTLHFLSDTYVTKDGWVVEAVCNDECTTNVDNTNDTGTGSLRFALNCVQDGSFVTIDNMVLGDTVVLESPINIDKATGVLIVDGTDLTIQASTTGPVFLVGASGNFQLKNVKLIGGSIENGAAIQNSGSLILENVEVHPSSQNPNPTSTVINTGNINIKGQTQIMN